MSKLLSLLLLIIALGVLVTIHELGHFIAAKSFNVYCSDFSIGFGPKIVNIKRKGHETSFKIGILPLGGYVSMYGEGVELPEGVNIPKTRSLEGISRWKRFIIMSAGIIMNFVLAYVIFFICASCFPQYDVGYINQVKIKNNDKIVEKIKIIDSEYSLKDGDILSVGTFSLDKKTTFSLLGYYDNNNFIPSTHYDETTDSYYTFGLNVSNAGIYDLDDYSNLISIYVSKLSEGYLYELNKETNKEEFKSVSTYLPIIKDNAIQIYNIPSGANYSDVKVSFKNINEDKSYIYNALINISSSKDGIIDPLYLGVNYKKYWAGWDSFKIASDNWVTSTKLISKALGGLFVGKGWDQLGGPISIFTQTTAILEKNPFNSYLQSWGIISVNLALFNLLPFPGLDGWHMLVTIVEGITNTFKKYFYYKKNSKYAKTLLKSYENLDIELNDLKKDFKNKYNESYKKELFNHDESNDLDPKYLDFKSILNKENEIQEFVIENHLEEVGAFKEWVLPEKVKNIVSYIGLALLFILMAVVFVLDIIRIA